MTKTIVKWNVDVADRDDGGNILETYTGPLYKERKGELICLLPNLIGQVNAYVIPDDFDRIIVLHFTEITIVKN